MSDLDVIAVVINMFRLPDLLTSDMVVCNGLYRNVIMTNALNPSEIFGGVMGYGA